MSESKTKGMQTRCGGSFTVDIDGKRTKTKVKKAAKKTVNKPEKEKDDVD